MAQKDKFEDLTVESILAEVEAQQSGEAVKIWSMDEIDALLSEEETKPKESKVQATFAPTKQTQAEALPQKAAAEVENPPIQTEKITIHKAQKPEAPKPEIKKQEEQSQEASSTIATSFAQYFPNSKEKEESFSAVEQLLATIKSSTPKAKPQAEPQEEAEIKVHIVDDEEEIAPMLQGVTPRADTVQEEQEEPATKESDIQGQISLEKTRLFNEVEAHAVYKADVPHHFSNTAKHESTPPEELKKAYRGMETDKNRSRFLNRPQQELEKTREHKEILSSLPPQTIEKPGVIVQNADDKTQVIDGLQAIPTLVTPEDVLEKTRVQEGPFVQEPQPETTENELENQMMLDGFQTEDEVEIVDEEEAEQDLYARRQKKAEKFKLFPGLTHETPTDEQALAEDTPEDEEALEEDAESFLQEKAARIQKHREARQRRKERKLQENATEQVQVLREFYGPKDKKPVYEIYYAEKRAAKIRVIISGILAGATLLSAVLVRLTGAFDWVGGTAGVYSATALLFLAVLAVSSLPMFKTALQALQKKQYTAELGLLVTFILSFLQAAVSFAYAPELSRIPLYTPIAAMGFFLYHLAVLQKRTADIANFGFLLENTENFSKVKQIEDEEKAYEIGRGLLLEDPDIEYSQKISFPQNFVEVSKEKNPMQKIYQLVLPMLLFAGAVIGLITGILYRSFFMGISALTITVLASMPISAMLSTIVIQQNLNKQLKAHDAFIASVASTQEATEANAVVVDAADLFNTAACHLSGMKLYHKMRVDEALLYTAAMVIESGGTLKEVFDNVILKKREILPAVESLAYEEKLGCSGWIYNQRVLVGSRNLLQKHNVELPSLEEERRFKKADSEILYLAVEGKVAALFVVTYASNSQTASYLQRLEKYGVNILVRTSDPNITEALLEQSFRLPNNLVKILNPVAGKIFRGLVKEEPKKEPCGILHRGGATNGLCALLGAFLLGEKFKIAETLLYIGCGISVAFMAVICFFTGLAQAGVLEIVFFQILWTLLVTQVPKIKKL